MERGMTWVVVRRYGACFIFVYYEGDYCGGPHFIENWS